MNSPQETAIALSELEAARTSGAPIYEIQSGGVTLDITPNVSTLKKVVDTTMDCTVYLVNPGGSKRPVAFRCRNKMVFNHTAVDFYEAA